MQKVQWKTTEKVSYLSLESWEEQGLSVAFSARYGGVSPEPYESLNLGLHVGDEQEKVLHNRKQLLGALDLELEHVVCCEQVHGNKVVSVDERHEGQGAFSYSTALKGIDGLVTQSPGLVLMSYYADCIPLFFFDPVKRVIGLAHAGWKGTMLKIGLNTVTLMQAQYGSKAEDIQVFIGPGIGECCFEIQADLKKKVDTAFPRFHDIIKKSDDRYFWDLKNTNSQMLREAGIKEKHIICSQICTCCDPHFYSYRRECGQTGRMAAVLALRC